MKLTLGFIIIIITMAEQMALPNESTRAINTNSNNNNKKTNNNDQASHIEMAATTIYINSSNNNDDKSDSNDEASYMKNTINK